LFPLAKPEVFQTFTGGTDATGPVLARVAARRYGASAAPLVRQGWTAFSDGFPEMKNSTCSDSTTCGKHAPEFKL